MATLAVVVAGLAVLVSTYVFGFQRLTRQLAIARTGSLGAQALMTPSLVGLVGWLGTIGTLVGAALLWASYGWQFGVGFYVFHWIVMAIMPFGFLRNHYLSLVRSELGRQMYGPADKDVVASLMVECLGLR